MDAIELLEELEDIIDKGVSVPFSGRCLLDKDELLEVLAEVKLKLPGELKEAKWIKEERERIIADAKTEANNLIKTANDQIIAMVDENEITRKAKTQADDIIEQANIEAFSTRSSSYEYADYLLENVENVVVNTIKDLEQCINIVKNNRMDMKNK
ncbi:MAG: ATP synthase F0 subunit B [Ruminococcaceae bacterium]|nr:ATP synthase F0 subunit B [Oscillospiraceae bacterium]